MALRIAVIGAGGLGGLFGARLVRAGADVTFLVRGDTLQALTENGIAVHSPEGTFRTPVVATDDPTTLSPVDIVLHTTKSPSFRRALVDAIPAFGVGTLLVTTQNGVEAPYVAAEILGPERVVPGVARVFSRVDSPGVIEVMAGPAELVFGRGDGEPSPTLDAFARVLIEAGVTAAVVRDIWVQVWLKAMYVVPHGALGALVDEPLGVLRGPLRGSFAMLAGEVGAVGRARGIPIEDDAVGGVLEFIDRLPGQATASMQRDIVAGRPSELDSQAGALSRMAAAAGVPTPLLDLVYRALAGRMGRAAS